MREGEIERRFVSCIRSVGGWAIKLTSPGLAGLPDRLVLFPDGHVVFAELKAPGKKLRALQEVRKKQLEKLGFKVYVIDDMEKIGEVIRNEVHTT